MQAKILALDTTTENCSVVLLINDHQNNESLTTRSIVVRQDHSKKILSMIDEVLKEANISLQDLDAIAFTQGPGSFTGVRITIAVAQGLSFAANVPLIAISTLKSMAQAGYRLHNFSNVAVAIDARMNEIYWACYERVDNKWQLIDQEQVISAKNLVKNVDATNMVDKKKSWLTVGSAWQVYNDELSQLNLSLVHSSILYPDAQDVASLAKTKLYNGDIIKAQDATPVYLRDNVAWQK